MASNNPPLTGTKSVTSSASTIASSGELLAGVWITVPSSASNGIEVRRAGASNGDKMEVNSSQENTKFFPCLQLDDIEVIRDGGSDVTISYYAF